MVATAPPIDGFSGVAAAAVANGTTLSVSRSMSLILPISVSQKLLFDLVAISVAEALLPTCAALVTGAIPVLAILVDVLMILAELR